MRSSSVCVSFAFVLSLIVIWTSSSTHLHVHAQSPLLSLPPVWYTGCEYLTPLSGAYIYQNRTLTVINDGGLGTIVIDTVYYLSLFCTGTPLANVRATFKTETQQLIATYTRLSSNLTMLTVDWLNVGLLTLFNAEYKCSLVAGPNADMAKDGCGLLLGSYACVVCMYRARVCVYVFWFSLRVCS